MIAARPTKNRSSSSGALPPLIIDTDIGGDPDDAFMLICAARLPELALVITADEIGGERARLARYLLDLMGRTDVRVVAGADLGNTRYWVMDGVTPTGIAHQCTDVLGAVEAVCATAAGVVRWVGCGPLSTLARILHLAPELAEQLVITQMGGRLHDPGFVRAEHNFRLDPDAARLVVATAHHVTLVVADTTFNDKIALYPGHEVHRKLAAPDAPLWARLLADHLDRWAEAFGYTSKQHDPMALWVALGVGVAELAPIAILITHDGRVIEEPAGRPTQVSGGADYEAFNAWFDAQLTWDAA